MKKKIDKPVKQTKTYYDYNECRNYLENKYGYDERDYSKRFKRKDGKLTGINNDVEYRDFWHWVLDHNQISNGCFITFYKEDLEDPEMDFEDWQKEIYKRYIDEFADENGELEMYVWW